uniref:Uncharacterized protein n=1 Tax=Sphaerodactylus townsendi TaxID=933632 RepID=A0ACB8EVG1_9SAUR
MNLRDKTPIAVKGSKQNRPERTEHQFFPSESAAGISYLNNAAVPNRPRPPEESSAFPKLWTFLLGTWMAHTHSHQDEINIVLGAWISKSLYHRKQMQWRATVLLSPA